MLPHRCTTEEADDIQTLQGEGKRRRCEGSLSGHRWQQEQLQSQTSRRVSTAPVTEETSALGSVGETSVNKEQVGALLRCARKKRREGLLQRGKVKAGRDQTFRNITKDQFSAH